RAAIALAVVLALGPAFAWAGWQRVELEPPQKLVIRTLSGESFSGDLVAYDDRSLELRLDDEQVRPIAWSDVPTRRVYAILSKLLEARDATAWLDLGGMLLARDDGKVLAERALGRAV